MTVSEAVQPKQEVFEDPRLNAAYADAVKEIYLKAAEGESDIAELVLRPVAESVLVHMSDEVEAESFVIGEQTFSNAVVSMLEQLQVEGELDASDEINKVTTTIVMGEGTGGLTHKPLFGVHYKDGSGSRYSISHNKVRPQDDSAQLHVNQIR